MASSERTSGDYSAHNTFLNPLPRDVVVAIFLMGLKSGWINKERKFCKGLLNIRISPLVQEVPNL